jgi:hypothetical protein
MKCVSYNTIMEDVRRHKAAVSWATWEAAVQLVKFSLVSFQ